MAGRGVCAERLAAAAVSSITPSGGAPGTWDVTLVTHEGLPEGAPDDVLLAQAMRARGLLVEFLPWNDRDADWQAGRLTMVRSAWDYHHHSAAWLAWIASTSAKTVLLNGGQTLRWNTDKRYLRDLVGAGVACIPTYFVEPHGRLGALPQGHREWIVKPAVGASARGVRRFTQRELPTQGRAYVDQLARTGAVLIQPYIGEVETARERSLVFVGGRFTHAFTKPPFSAGATGGTAIARHSPSTAERALADAALGTLAGELAYARVDIVPTPDGPQLMELELIEPDLGLRLEPTAIDGLVAVCMEHLERG